MTVLCGLIVPGVLLGAQKAPAELSTLAAQSAAAIDQADQAYFHRNLAGNLEKSQALLEDLNAKGGGNPQILWRLGRGLERMGEIQETRKEKLKLFGQAESFLRQSIAKDPGFSESHFWLGVVLGRTGETRGVLKSVFLVGPIRAEMKKTLELDPKHGGAHRVLGEVLMHLPGFAGGSKKGAIREMEKAVELSPNHTSNYTALAHAYLASGYPQKAASVLREIFEIKKPDDPGSFDDDIKEAKSMLESLEKK